MAQTNIAPTPPIALTIAGSDSSAGAGIQADLKTFAAHSVYGTCAITALTAQNTLGVDAIFSAPADFVAAQIESVCTDMTMSAVKIGMLCNAPILAVVAQKLKTYHLKNIVLDPVMMSSSGRRLLDEPAVNLLKTSLLPLCTLVTPNLLEAATLLDTKIAQTSDEMVEQGKKILNFGCPFVLMKGGHLDGQDSPDILVSYDRITHFPARRITSHNTHGTGCTLSSAIAANLAKGYDIASAIKAAKAYVSLAIEAGASFELGKGKGPLNHFASFEPLEL